MPQAWCKVLGSFYLTLKMTLGQTLVPSCSAGEIEVEEKLDELPKFTHWGSGCAGA